MSWTNRLKLGQAGQVLLRQHNSWTSVKRCLPVLPLFGLAPAGAFLGEYLSGLGMISPGFGFLGSSFCFFILPWLVSALFAALPRVNFAIRVMLFVGALATQIFFVFELVPPGATSEMMGIARRFKEQFPPDQLLVCANKLRREFHAGTLAVSPRARDDYNDGANESAVVIADAGLPVPLRGRFREVYIQRDRDTGDEQVLFAVSQDTGIICGGQKNAPGFFVCPMADNVEAYRYQRM